MVVLCNDASAVNPGVVILTLLSMIGRIKHFVASHMSETATGGPAPLRDDLEPAKEASDHGASDSGLGKPQGTTKCAALPVEGRLYRVSWKGLVHDQMVIFLRSVKRGLSGKSWYVHFATSFNLKSSDSTLVIR
jgi:hypothetical protein